MLRCALGIIVNISYSNRIMKNKDFGASDARYIKMLITKVWIY